ncbi:branched-chain-amino-acid aminotransferase TOXF [Pyrenophora tritici-repentis]|nr:branched-chain-amino-acid aminotransferase TOXF [Pyrenophora tritici-repentis]
MTIPAPNSDYQWGVYSSKKNNVNGHCICKWTAETGWSEPEFVQNPYLQVHGLAPGLHYGQQVYEGLQARRTQDNNILIFRAEANAKRMQRSAKAVSMPSVSEELFLKAVHLAVARNAEFVPPADFAGSLYIRPFQFGSGCQIGLEPPDEFIFCVFVQPHIAFHGHGTLRALVSEDFDRAATRGTGAVKVGGNYAPVMKWSREARKPENGGWGVLLHVDSKTQTFIDEFSTSGFIAFERAVDESTQLERTTVVVADSPAAIESITAVTVSELASSFGWEVVKRQVRLDELASFSEVLAVGTAAGLVSVSAIRHQSTDRDFSFVENGPCYQKLSSTLKDIQHGRVADTFGWCAPLRFEEFVAT